ncbi:MAG TPA: glycosyltransferase [Candidatus Limnocylindria bacterium]
MSEPLRVAVFAESYLPYLSGVTVATETLARGLAAAGHRVLLVAPRPGGDGQPGTSGAPGPEPACAWLDSYAAPPPAPAGYRLPLPIAGPALRMARDFAPQVVHAQSPFVSGLMARRLAQRIGAPLVFTHHTRFGDYSHYLGPLAQAGRRVAAAYVGDYWRGCAAVVAPGSELAAEIRAALGDRPRPLLRTIPTGVDVGGIAVLAAADVRGTYGWPADAVVVVSLGRLAEEKNVRVLLEAFAGAAAGEPRLRFLLVGGGPSTDAVRRRIAGPDLLGRVALTGRLPHGEALAQVRGCDLFAFASQTETQGLVLAEALAAGVPVVALRGPGVADSVRDRIDGAIVDPTGADPAAALAAEIRAVAADPLRRASLAAAARAGADRFAVERRIGATVDLYRALLAGR